MQAADLKHALSDWSDRSNWSDNMPMTDFPKPYRSFKNMRNRFQFGFGFGPFLVFLALGKQSAPGEKAEPTTLNAHAAQRNVKLRGAQRVDRTEKTAVITAGRRLVLPNETAGPVLWDGQNGGGGEKLLEARNGAPGRRQARSA